MKVLKICIHDQRSISYNQYSDDQSITISRTRKSIEMEKDQSMKEIGLINFDDNSIHNISAALGQKIIEKFPQIYLEVFS